MNANGEEISIAPSGDFIDIDYGFTSNKKTGQPTTHETSNEVQYSHALFIYIYIYIAEAWYFNVNYCFFINLKGQGLWSKRVWTISYE